MEGDRAKIGRPKLTMKCDRLPVAIRKDILRMAAEGHSAHSIQRWLGEEKGLKDYGYFAILQWLKLRGEVGKQFIYDNPEFKNKVQDEFSDIIVDYSKMYGEMKKLYEDCKAADNTKGMLLAAEEMRKQVELIKTLLFDTGSSKTEPTLVEGKRSSYRELDRAISKALEGAVNDGVIELKQTEQTIAIKPRADESKVVDVDYKLNKVVEEEDARRVEETVDTADAAGANEGDSQPKGEGNI